MNGKEDAERDEIIDIIMTEKQPWIESLRERNEDFLKILTAQEKYYKDVVVVPSVSDSLAGVRDCLAEMDLEMDNYDKLLTEKLNKLGEKNEPTLEELKGLFINEEKKIKTKNNLCYERMGKADFLIEDLPAHQQWIERWRNVERKEDGIYPGGGARRSARRSRTRSTRRSRTRSTRRSRTRSARRSRTRSARRSRTRSARRSSRR